jgi:hypothetical protein
MGQEGSEISEKANEFQFYVSGEVRPAIVGAVFGKFLAL